MNKIAHIVIPNKKIGGEAVGYLKIKVIDQTTENHEIYYDNQSNTPLQMSVKDDKINLGKFLSKQDQTMIMNYLNQNKTTPFKIFNVTLNNWKPKISR